MQTSILLRNGLEPLAIALILAPEPSSTVIGLALLAYIRTQRYLQGKNRENAPYKVQCQPRYTFKMELVRGETIVYRSYPALSGQLPPASPAGKGMFYNPALWRAYLQHSARKIESAGAVHRETAPAAVARTLKRPVNMGSVPSYRLPPLYRPQPAMAAARA